jgi:hypothetical protein
MSNAKEEALRIKATANEEAEKLIADSNTEAERAKAEIEERKKRELAELQDKVEQLIAAGELPGREKERRGIGSKLKDTLACNYGGWETKKFFTKHKTPKHQIVLKQFSVFPKARLTIPISTQLFRHEERGIIYITKRFIHNPNQLHQLYTTRI